MKFRLIFSILLFILVFSSPFWVYFPLAILGIIYFKMYWEGLLMLLTSDFYFGVNEGRFNEISYISFLIAIIIFIFTQVIRKKMK